MKLLAVHPSGLMFTRIFLRLEPLGLELIVLQRKHLGIRNLVDVAGLAMRLASKRQTNFIRSMLKFNSVFNPKLQLADHAREVNYEIPLPPVSTAHIDAKRLYIHAPTRKHRALDEATERFVDATRLGAA